MEFSLGQETSILTLLDMITRSSRRTYKEFIRQLTKMECHNIARVLEEGGGKLIFSLFFVQLLNYKVKPETARILKVVEHWLRLIGDHTVSFQHIVSFQFFDVTGNSPSTPDEHLYMFIVARIG